MLTVIAGGMFAEKSTELQRRGKRLTRAGKNVVYFKPEFDNRYSETEIVTHDGQKVKAGNVPTDTPETIFMALPKFTDVILIDEIQFFNAGIIAVINHLLKDGYSVIVAGLDMDSDAKPFDVTATLMALAEEVVKLKAVCSRCGDDAWVTYNDNKINRIELGTDEYTPMCRYCYDTIN
ncbi:thymidine kinase [Priestia megaterium]|uniref:thymidine kinase n=1 Tax=Priestia megaterium TaxID=1404 RepID=UPI002863FBAC|nr:thymidine kinase [Priestia megaterium]MDR7207625.1 thymidine kinase [Priestia megaterium]